MIKPNEGCLVLSHNVRKDGGKLNINPVSRSHGMHQQKDPLAFNGKDYSFPNEMEFPGTCSSTKLQSEGNQRKPLINVFDISLLQSNLEAAGWPAGSLLSPKICLHTLSHDCSAT